MKGALILGTLCGLLSACASFEPLRTPTTVPAEVTFVSQILPADMRVSTVTAHGRLLLLGLQSGDVVVLDHKRNVVLRRWQMGHPGAVQALVVTDADEVVSIATGGTVCRHALWSGARIGCVRYSPAFPSARLSAQAAMSLSPDGLRLAIGKGVTVEVWDTRTHEKVLSASDDQLKAITAVATDGQTTIVSGTGGTRAFTQRTYDATLGAVKSGLYVAKGSTQVAWRGDQGALVQGGSVYRLKRFGAIIRIDGPPIARLGPGAGATPVALRMLDGGETLITHGGTAELISAQGALLRRIPRTGAHQFAAGADNIFAVGLPSGAPIHIDAIARAASPPVFMGRGRPVTLRFSAPTVQFDAGAAIFGAASSVFALHLGTGRMAKAAAPARAATTDDARWSVRPIKPERSNWAAALDTWWAGLAIHRDGALVGRYRTRQPVSAQVIRDGIVTLGSGTAEDSDRYGARLHQVRLRDGDVLGIMPGLPEGMRSIALSANGRQSFAGGGVPGRLGGDAACCAVQLTNWRTESQRVWRGHTASVHTVALDPSGRFGLSASDDGTARLWRLDGKAPDRSQEACDAKSPSLGLVAAEGEWLMFDDCGRFDASADGHRLMVAVHQLRDFRLDQLAPHANRPDLLLASMGVGAPSTHAHLQKVHQRRLKRLGNPPPYDPRSAPRVDGASIVQTDGHKAELEIALHGSDLDHVDVWVNGVPLGRVAAASTVRRWVPVSALTDVVEISVTNRAGLESPRVTWPVKDLPGRVRYLPVPRARPRILMVAFGVSHYPNISKLDYAHCDAKEMERAFESVGAQVKRLDQTEVTQASIKAARVHFADMRPDDIAVVFASGHGVLSTDGQYMFAPYPLDKANLAATGAPFTLIEDLLAGIGSHRKLLLLDTCVSGDREPGDRRPAGAVSESFAAKTPQARSSDGIDRKVQARVPLSAERFIYRNLQRRTGAVIFSASQGDEFAYEDAAWGHGAFTAELLCALSGKADEDGDGRISLPELRRYVTTGVKRRTKNLQTPTVNRENIHARFELPIMPGARCP